MRIALGAEQVVIVAPSKLPAKRRWQTMAVARPGGQGLVPESAGCGCRAALLKSYDRLQLPIRIAAEIFGEDLQLSLLAHSGGLGLVPRRQFEQSAHRRQLRILDVVDFALPATVTLIRNAGPGRFDPVLDLLARELKAKLG